MILRVEAAPDTGDDGAKICRMSPRRSNSVVAVPSDACSDSSRLPPMSGPAGEIWRWLKEPVVLAELALHAGLALPALEAAEELDGAFR